ncbi:MAG TPA: alpha/beta hydrolase [Hyphomicrobiaceae bacterium]|nr:alpha/beta hydrolase [Hyphomicrobiaceae bacterium]
MSATASLLRERIAAALADPELAWVASGLACRVRFEVGEAALSVAFADGATRLADCGSGGEEIAISASPADWDRLLPTPPPPTFHAFTALAMANPAFRVDGDGLRIAQARPALERLLECICAAPTLPAEPVERAIGQVSGRYVPLSTDRHHYDLYVESAGSGTPVLFLHTAGADSRQYLDQLADVELGRRYHMIAPDLPFHGRTFPARGYDGGRYQLDADTYRDWVAAVIEQAVGRPVILAGCSMGAAISLVLAAERPGLLKGVIAIEPPFRSKGRRNPFQMHVAVHGGLHNASYVRSLLSPTSPLADRRRAAWIYAQCAPGIYPGDLAFYSDEFDAAVVAPRIDPSRVPLALLCGSYDYSATPADGRRIAELVPGALFREMPGLGHFPMTEHPDAFRPHLVAALDHLLSA